MPIHRLFINFILPEIVVKEQTDRHRQNGTEESDQQIYVTICYVLYIKTACVKT